MIHAHAIRFLYIYIYDTHARHSCFFFFFCRDRINFRSFLFFFSAYAIGGRADGVFISGACVIHGLFFFAHTKYSFLSSCFSGFCPFSVGARVIHGLFFLQTPNIIFIFVLVFFGVLSVFLPSLRFCCDSI